MIPFIVGFAGPSASGKTTLCKKIHESLHDSLLLHLDDYFKKDTSVFPRLYGYKNWEVPSDLDLDLLHLNLSELKQGRTVQLPKSDYGHFQGYQGAGPSKLIIVEGFLLYHDPKVRNDIDLKFFIDVPEEVCLHRRLARMDFEKEDYCRRVVMPEWRKYGLPTKRFADVILDGEEPIDRLMQKVLPYFSTRRLF